MDKLVSGKELSKEIREELTAKVAQIKESGKRVPTLCVIMVGNNPASASYVKGKEKACKEIGMNSKMYHLEECTEEELIELIEEQNKDPEVDGILVQLPLPKGFNEKNVLFHIDPSKDVDGLHPMNLGRLYSNQKGFVPCTPKGIMRLLDKMGVELEGKRVVVIGRSQLVGGPVAKLLQDKNATVTVCHSRTKDLASITRQAEVLVVAVGKPHMITAEHVAEGTYVIDVGVNRVDGKLIGDVDTEGVLEKCAKITPVPGGVGPMTITMLLDNTLEAYLWNMG
ncbi:MAG: bifunctional methylenetetrahydrofolate dehydrogenase/methenyltetrahydrofolate cyclohydrolase FolD [Erysipelotrichaceae bacterium]|nr:bifunctional methylenetetrahydrofolate dehydrogenase/methenyltetrahydrofolate cyclohydrolase FolD [Erysipelotrichaceae bacterium]